jgi:hypothetical protein
MSGDFYSGVGTWRECLEWAKRGDPALLIATLRGAQSCDNSDVLAFLADHLAGKIKLPRGKPAKRPIITLGTGPDGQIDFVDVRDVRRFEIKKWIRDNKATTAAAAEHFRMHEESVKHIVRRATPKRST